MNKGRWSRRRHQSISIPVGRNALFIYCGKCTEPLYFNDAMKFISDEFYKQSKGQTRLEFDYEIDAVDPLNMAKDIPLLISKKGAHYDEVWVVFDKDDFPKDNFDNAIKSIQYLDEKSKSTSYHALWSNQCVELWFLLHFEYLQAKLNRDDYYPKLTNHLQTKYSKNSKNLFRELNTKGSLVLAIKNSHKLLELNAKKTYSDKWPATNIVELFDKYQNYIK